MKQFILRAVTATLTAWILLAAIPGLAQIANTTLTGTVRDPSGAILPGVTVTAVQTDTNQTFKTTTNASGEYNFAKISPGHYTITVDSPNFASQSKLGNLIVGQPASVDFTMSVQVVTQTVNVSAETVSMNTTDATLGNAINGERIRVLPMLDRNVPSLLSLQPGVLYLGNQVDTASDNRTGSVNGVRSDQSDITMDGVDDNGYVNGYAFQGVLRETLDSIDEFRVTTQNANADQGRSAGAQVNLLTKTGTNQIHGTLYEYNRNTLTAANDWFNKQAQLASGEPNVPGKFIRNTFGVAVGGRIIKDKLFWFGNYEGQRTAENQQITQTVPTASFKAGDVQYLSNNQPVTLTPAQIAGMDPNCSGNGTCPWGPGDDPNILSLFNTFYPTANGTSQGDGLNLGSYSFSSPDPASLNTSIARFDYIPNNKHRLFVRGNLQKDVSHGPLNFPGQPPSYVIEDNSKGIAGGDTWMLTNNLINDLRYGYVRRGYGNTGIGQGEYTVLRFMAQPVSETRSTIVSVPVHNVVDNMTWTHGNHTVSYGVNYRLITNNNSTDDFSYGSGNTNEYWLGPNGGQIAGTGSSLDPGAFGHPAVDSGFANSYDIAIALLTGLVPQTTNQYNFQVSKNGQFGTALPAGAFVKRSYREHQFEYYLQDQWRVQPNLTVTLGLRHLIQQTPFEVNGQQVGPTIDMHQWFKTRYEQAALGNTVEPDISFAPNGQARGLPAYWPMHWKDIAPRIAINYAPDAKTSIRAGFGIFYFNYGMGIVDTFNSLGSYGLSTSITNPANQYTVDTAPRFTGIHDVPPLQGVNVPNQIPYPYTPPNNVNTGFAITWGIDNRIQTPYMEAMNLSFQRELPRGFTVEVDYVGQLGRHLLQQLDLAEPTDLVDPKSGTDYYTAARLLSQAVDQGQTNVAPIPYWEHLFPFLATGGQSATQNIYSNIWIYNRGNETGALANLDVYCQYFLGCGPNVDANGNPQPRYYQRQFSSLYVWSSIGSSSYNAGQVTVRRIASNGFQFDLSYTLSNSIDMGSDTERQGELNSAGSFSEIINSFHPEYNRAVSDFNTRNLFTGDAIDQLPFGRGRQFASNAGTFLNALIGNWTISAIDRWSSGLPFGVINPQWATNWQIESWGVNTAPVKLHKHRLPDGSPEVFADPTAINNGVAKGTPIRLAYAGEAGQRNAFRGDGYFDIDTAVAKVWQLPKGESIRFDWEVFNATNSVRFDDSPVSSFGGLNTQMTSGTFGVYSSLLTLSRKQQFSLRYSF